MNEPDRSAPETRVHARDAVAFWVPLLAGLALVGIGLFYIIAKQSKLVGPSLICTGLILMPWPALSILGGLGFIGLGVYECIFFKSVTTLGAILVILGIVTVVDRGGRVIRK